MRLTDSTLGAAALILNYRSRRTSRLHTSYFDYILTSCFNVAAGIQIDKQQVTPGGSSIYQHANISLPMGQQTKTMLDGQPWDFVVFQDQSEAPGGGKDTGNTPLTQR